MKFKISTIAATVAVALSAGILAAPAEAATSGWDWQATSVTKEPVGTKHKVEIKIGRDNKVTRTVDGKVESRDSAAAFPDYRFNGTRFAGRWICQNDWTGSATPMAATGDAFEAGTNPVGTVVFSWRNAPAGQLCTGYDYTQMIYSHEYNDADNACSKIYGNAVAADPTNPYYDSLWAGTVTIGINVHYADCRGTAQRRNNVASRANGYAIGLEEFSGSAVSIMNLNHQYQYNLAGAWDRNNVYGLML